MLSLRAVIGVILVELLLLASVLVLAVDLEVHRNVEHRQGTNSWGYRGAARFKPSGGARVAVVGGCAAYGYAVDWEGSFPYNLEQRLNQLWRKSHPGYYTEVVNLAAMGDGAASYVTTLRDYAYLKADTVCIYDGYSGLGTTTAGSRHDSLPFRTMGYLPILPDVISGRRRWREGVVVDPILRDGAEGDVSCNGASRGWCAAMLDTVGWALDHGMRAMVVTPPYISRRHEQQQASLAAALAARFGAQPRVRYVNLGTQVDVHDGSQSFDGAHLTTRGNEIVAENLVDRVFELLRVR
jgi:hypothetical protein